MGKNYKYRIEKGKQEKQQGTNIGSVGACFVLLFFCLLAMYGMPRAIASAFHIKMNDLELYVILGISCAWFIFSLNVKKAGRILIPIYILVYVGWCVVRFAQIRSGLYIYAETILKFGNRHIGWEFHLPIPPLHSAQTGIMEGVLLLYIAISFFLCYSNFFRGGRVFTYILATIHLLLPFIFGEVPDTASVIMVMVGAAGLYAMRQRNGKILFHGGITAIAMLLLSAIIGAVLLMPAIQYASTKKDVLKERMMDFWEMPGIVRMSSGRRGGVGNGDLKGGSFVTDTRIQLEVTMDQIPIEPIYLQGYIGAIYQKDRWFPITEEQKKDMDEMSVTEIKNKIYTKFSKAGESAKNMKIHALTANAAYKYMPYGAEYTKEDQLQGDTYVEGAKEKEYEVTYTTMPEVSTLGSVLEEEQRFVLDSPYETYVWEQYISVSEEIWEAFEPIVNQYEFYHVDGYPQYIKRVLSDQTSYSLNPGTVPPGKEYATYFFFENKKGYCMHYATTTALLLRMKGFPSRFVAGYIVQPGQFKEQEDGSYKASVSGNNAHAWAEVYSDSYGWLPLETTPGYTGEMEEGSLPTETEVTPIAPKKQPEETKQPVPPDVEEEKETVEPPWTDKQEGNKGKEDTSGKVTTLLIAGLVCVALCIAGYVYRRVRNLRRRRNDKAGDFFQSLYTLLVIGGMEDTAFDGVQISTFISNICPGEAKEAAEMMTSVLKANYSEEQISREEYERIKHVYQAVYRNVWQKASVWKRIVILCKTRSVRSIKRT